MALSLQRYTSPYRCSGKHLQCPFKLLRIDNQEKRPMIVATNKGDVLPEALIFEILSLLPVEDLLRCKCVCKSWYALISCSDFVSKHLKNYYNHHHSRQSCLAHFRTVPNELDLFELVVDETLVPKVVASEELDYRPMYGSYVCGPCDGIYYLYQYYEARRALWNPAIKELKFLPSLITKPNLPSSVSYSICEAYGFGFDPLTKDYKVVVIKCYWSDDEDENISCPASVLVYSLRTDCWTYCGDLSQIHCFDLNSNKCYTFLDGSYYLLLLSEPDDCVVSFDMATDAFQEIHAPNYDKPASRSLAIYRDSVAFLTIDEVGRDFGIWILNEGLWTKKFTLGPLPGIQCPVGHWLDDKLLLDSDDGRLILCDPVTQETTDFGFHAGLPCRGIFVYRESLVSINGAESENLHL